MKAELINSYKAIFEIVCEYQNSISLHPQFVFRGQANSNWYLEPSFSRIARSQHLALNSALQLERECLNKFCASAKDILPLKQTYSISHGINYDILGWLPIMQHYSAPTRLLDWTSSVWVALYFCCSSYSLENGSLWIADFKKACDNFSNRTNEEEFTKQIENPITPTDNDVLIFISTGTNHERIESQQGKFSICTNPLTNHGDILSKISALRRIDISASIKPEIMKHLSNMNISAKTLFPGLDGLGKSLIEYCNLWDDRSRIS